MTTNLFLQIFRFHFGTKQEKRLHNQDVGAGPAWNMKARKIESNPLVLLA